MTHRPSAATLRPMIHHPPIVILDTRRAAQLASVRVNRRWSRKSG
jgi:hypothetical protein